MKNKKLLFNHLVLQYHKSLGKLKRLSERGLNIRKQNILGKRIEKIKQQLLSIKQALQSATAIASIISAVAVIHPENSIAQNFQPPVVNPFSLNLTSDSIGNIKSVDFADLDADGDFDAVIYNNLSDALYILKNDGTPENPDFIEAVLMPISLTETETLDNICFGDLDADGDFDLMGGGLDGNFIYFENIGTDSLLEYSPPQLNPFQLQNTKINELDYWTTFVGLNTLEFVDLDFDGDLDIYTISEFYIFDTPNCYSCYGTYEFYYQNFYLENTGDSINPSFSTPYGNDSYYYSGIGDFADLDMDGDFDYISLRNNTQNTSGLVEFYKNMSYFYYGEQYNSYFTYTQNPFGLGLNLSTGLSSPTTVDFDNDNDMDLMFLKIPNYFFYYENKTCDSTISNLVDFNFNTGEFLAEQQGAQYQWYQCSGYYLTNYTAIPGAVNQNYITSNEGSYLVEINTGDCVAYSDCLEFYSCNTILAESYAYYTGDGMYSSVSNAEYQWLDCNNGNQIIPDEINQLFSPDSAGSYAVEMNFQGCIGTSNCLDFTICDGLSNDIIISGDTLTALQNNAYYQWFDCSWDYYEPIYEEHYQNFLPQSSGSYGVAINVNNCEIYSDCIEFTSCNSLYSNQVTTNNSSLVASQSDANYQWFDCYTNQLVEGEINQTFFPQNPGFFYVQIEINNCAVTSECVDFMDCNTVSDELYLVDNTLIAAQNYAFYQWYNCSNYEIIIGETSQTFTPTISGTYAAEILLNNCTVTSECIDVTVTAIDKITQTNTFNIIPNPTEGKLNITTDKPFLKATIQITSVTGQLIFEQKNVSGFQFDIDLSNHANGLYFLEISENGNVTRKKIVKE